MCISWGHCEIERHGKATLCCCMRCHQVDFASHLRNPALYLSSLVFRIMTYLLP